MPTPRTTFSVTECVVDAWRAVRRHPRLGVYIALGNILVYAAGFIGVLGSLVCPLLSPMVLGGTALLGIRMVESRSPQARDSLAPFRRWWRFLGAYLLFWLVAVPTVLPAYLLIMFGMYGEPAEIIALRALIALLVSVAVYFAIRFGFWPYLLADSSRVGTVNALGRSWTMTRGRFWRLLGLALLMILIQIAGAACLIVGLLVTVPMMVLAFAAAYSRLRPADLAADLAAAGAATAAPWTGPTTTPLPSDTPPPATT